jgi:hypothetical protein
MNENKYQKSIPEFFTDTITLLIMFELTKN